VVHVLSVGQNIMWPITVSILILIALGMNHLIHGFGCWGFQAGGRFSSFLYSTQIVIAGFSAVSLYIIILRERHDQWLKDLVVATLLIFAVPASFFTIGYVAFTSIHFQGPENLIPFLIATYVTITLARIRSRIIYTPVIPNT
jgi:hypothetical protein